MKKTKFISSIMCIFIILTSVLMSASCENKTENKEPTSENDNEQIQSTAQETEISDELPEDLNFNGKTFKVLSRNEFQFGTEMSVDGLTGEIINDSIYNRNKAVEDRLNIKIEVTKIPGIWGKEAAFNSTVTKSVKAGDNAYDMVAGYGVSITPLAADGNFYNLKKVRYLDLNKPWWCQDLSNQMTIGGKLYFACGDLSQTMVSSLMCMFFNKRMMADYNIPDIYQTVLDGKWTHAKLEELCKGIYTDVNGDGKKDNGDTYGLAIEIGNYVDQMFFSYGGHFAKINNDGIPELIMGNEKCADIISKICDLYYANPGVYTEPETGDRPTRTMFINGQSLFNAGLFILTDGMRDMKDDYGIIPFPKYDENQEKYLGLVQDALSIFCVPATTADPDFVGACMEALCYESYQSVTPVYYETALKIKYTRGDENVQSKMLDIIREGAVFDFGHMNSGSLSWPIFMIRGLVGNKSKAYMSEYEKNEPTYQKGLQKLLEAYNKLEK